MQIAAIYCGDNLEILRRMPDEAVDLVYIDPPLNATSGFEPPVSPSKPKPDKYTDASQKLARWLRPRVKEVFRVLRYTGCLYFHCDPYNEAYLRNMLDGIFGAHNFRSLVVWGRAPTKEKSPQIIQQAFTNSYDLLLLYSKSDSFTFNQLYTRVPQQEVKHIYQYTDQQGRRYRLVDLTSRYADRPDRTYDFLGITRTWKYSKDRLEQAMKQGLIVQTRPDAVPAMKEYIDEGEGRPIGNLWTDIPGVIAGERLGYIGQKPFALLERIIRSSSNVGDIVLDAFCGSGTALHAAQTLGRRWIGIDISPTACYIASERVSSKSQIRRNIDFTVVDLPKKVKDLQNYTASEFADWVLLTLDSALKRDKPRSLAALGRDVSLQWHSLDVVPASDTGFDLRLSNGDTWFPVEIKNKKEVTERDISRFVAAMRRENCYSGIFVGFEFSDKAKAAVQSITAQEAIQVIPVTVNDLLASSAQVTA